MGHGDELAIVDAHFPAARTAARAGARLVQLAGATLPDAARAVLALMPLDDAGDGPAAHTMQVSGDPHAVPPAVADLQAVLRDASERPATALERFAFYARAERAFAVFVTGESRTYANVLLRKGVA
jgi:L-fucose mutarotase